MTDVTYWKSALVITSNIVSRTLSKYPFMKTLGSFINKKSIEARRTVIDQQSVFYVFQLVIKTEYGRLGAENITPVFFKEKKIFIKASGSTWASEIWLNRGHIVKKVNEQLGGEEIIDLAMS